MIINLSRISSDHNKKGFTIVELMITVSILGILTAVGFNSMSGFYEQRRLRNAALEAMDMIRERRAKVMAERLTTPDNCFSLNPDNINQRLVSGVTGLEVNAETGGSTELCFTSEEGSIGTQMTLLLSSPAVASQGNWCVVVSPLLAQTHLGWKPYGQDDCRFDSAGGSL
jgi:prepilin-type N-terminal cleavage/methylation domain-containing protein